MEIKVCVGSACYVKGSHEVIKAFEQLISKYKLEDKVILKAAFCLGNCTAAVSVMVDDTLHSVQPSNIEDFFREYVLKAKKK